MPGLKGGMDDATRATVDRFADALFELAAVGKDIARIADALEEHNNRLRTGIE